MGFADPADDSSVVRYMFSVIMPRDGPISQIAFKLDIHSKGARKLLDYLHDPQNHVHPSLHVETEELLIVCGYLGLETMSGAVYSAWRLGPFQ